MLLETFSITPAGALQELGNLYISELLGRMQILETLIEGRDLTEQQTQEAMEVCLLHGPLCLHHLLRTETLHHVRRK